MPSSQGFIDFLQRRTSVNSRWWVWGAIRLGSLSSVSRTPLTFGSVNTIMAKKRAEWSRAGPTEWSVVTQPRCDVARSFPRGKREQAGSRSQLWTRALSLLAWVGFRGAELQLDYTLPCDDDGPPVNYAEQTTRPQATKY